MEGILPPETEVGGGFERATVRQFTIFLENRVGKMTVLLRKFAEHGVRINAFSVEESADTSLLRLICSDPEAGRACLRENQFSFSETDVLAVEVPHGAEYPLIDVCQSLLSAEINIHYAYPLLRSQSEPAIALYVDDLTLATRLLIRRGFKILGETDLRS